MRPIILLTSLLPALCWAQTPCVNGMAGTYPCSNVDLMAHMNITMLGGQVNTADLWGWTDPLNGKEYAIIGMRNGTAFIDITNAAAPVRIGNLPSHITGSNTLWRDVDVSGNWCYVGSETAGHGLQVFDLTRLRNVTAPPVTFTEDAHYPGFGNSHTIFADKAGPYVYAVGTGVNSGGLNAIDVSDPLAPVLAGTYTQDGYIHENVVYHYAGPDLDHVGQEISFNFHSGTPDKITIVNVTDKSDMTRISTITYTGARIAHQGWLTEDHRYLLMNDEGDETFYAHGTRTRIFDVSDLEAPVYVGAYTGPVNSVDHNLYTHNGLVYEANYTSGLRILDAAGVASGTLVQSAYFDNYPSNNNATYDGAWGNYPYFASGNVIISDYAGGLFIVRPRLSLRVRAMLEGPFDGTAGLMHDSLRVQGLIPLTEPYTALGYVHVGEGGGETTTNAVLAVAGANAVVDWVVVELRDALDPSIVSASRAALIQRDGDVVAVDGVSPVSFSEPVADHHLAIRHRNHLGIMSATPLRISIAERNYDLTDGSVPLFGNQATKTIGTAQCLWSGNVVRDGQLLYTGAGNDRDPILQAIGGVVPTNSITGYRMEDTNLDGVVKYTGGDNDRDPILQNIGGTVPTNTRLQQLP
jgi:choice-of-anchor B domain-containing protein